MPSQMWMLAHGFRLRKMRKALQKLEELVAYLEKNGDNLMGIKVFTDKFPRESFTDIYLEQIFAQSLIK